MLEIIRIHNELLGTYGDRGNSDVLQYRAGLRKIKARVTDISYLDPLPRTGDIYLLGGAEDAAQLLSLTALRKGSILARAANKGAVVLAICAGFQLLGTKYTTRDEEFAGLGLLDVFTTPGDKRLVGDIAVQSSLFDAPLTGFENHSSVTSLGSDATPFATLNRSMMISLPNMRSGEELSLSRLQLGVASAAQLTEPLFVHTTSSFASLTSVNLISTTRHASMSRVV